MKRLFKIFKKMLLVVSGILVLLLLIAVIFINTSPQFGGSHSPADKVRYTASGHYEDGKFVNEIPTKLDYSLSNMWAMTKAYIKGNPNKTPKKSPPVMDLDTANWNHQTGDQMMWFGHSAILLRIDGKHILIDPMLGSTPAPHPTLGGKRYATDLPAEIEELPQIDLILISHDHYDHLDYGSIIKLKQKTKQFLVPLGVGAHLKKWGVDTNRISEFNWWDEHALDQIQLAFLPARHFSGRSITNSNSTLWGSWVIKGTASSIFFSGDSGFGPHFKEIGEKYGPFDLAMMECGQYNKLWPEIHMMPKETVQAARDAQTKMMMPIHWGAFTLALHDWNEPALQSEKWTKEIDMPLLIPEIGRVVSIDSMNIETSDWWK